MIQEELLKILVCPETKQPVHVLELAQLEVLNVSIRNGSIRNRGGEAVLEPLESALIREDGLLVYPIRDGIPVMLAEEAIKLP